MTSEYDSRYSWLRLIATTVLSTIGGVGMWSVVVALPAVQADFGVSRGAASAPAAWGMLGFAFGGIIMGHLVDRLGILRPMLIGIVALGLGYFLAASAPNIWVFALAHGTLIGAIGAATMFGPAMADVSLWFLRWRGTALAICAAGNYLAGAIWSPIIEYFIQSHGWRATHFGIGVFCLVAMPPLLLALQRPSQKKDLAVPGGTNSAGRLDALGLTSNQLTVLLAICGLACCVAMAMPQLHIVAYCTDLGYGPARGATMLSLMLTFGIVSRVLSGVIADRIGGLMTLFLGVAAQFLALLLYLSFDSLTSLYLISALFGLMQGGIVPSYAIIVREFFPPSEAASRTGIALMATLFGMALGGWLSGAIFDLSGSYQMAFLNGATWNLLALSIAGWLIFRQRQRLRAA